MSEQIVDLFELRVRASVRETLDAQRGPHSSWTASPAFRHVRGAHAGKSRRSNLRLLAIAAVLAVGGATAAGAWLRLTQLPQPTPTPLPTSSPGPTGDQVPAGVQFGPLTDLPADGLWLTDPVAGPDGTVVIAGVRAGSVVGNCPVQEAHALVGSPEAGWQEIAMGGGNIAAPTGYPNVRCAGAIPESVVHGANGYVAIGRAYFYNTDDSDSTFVGAFWHSADGLSWQFIDPRDVVGHDKPFVPAALAAVPGGYVAAGLSADTTDDVSSAVVLGSTDGINWNIVSTIAGTWSVEPIRLFVNGEELLLSGVEYACTADSRWLSKFLLARPGPHLDGAEARLWRSTDGGATWEPVDLMLSGLVTQPESMPQTEGDCAGLSPDDLDRFQSQGDLLGVIDGQAVVSRYEDQVAVSSDLVTWTTYDLPILDGGERRCCDLLSADEGGLLLIAQQSWRDLEGRRHEDQPGTQTQVWRLTDVGEVVKLPLGRPVPPTLGTVGGGLVRVGESEVWLMVHGRAFYRSTADTYRGWGTCTLAAEADCAFVMADLTAPGADLHGIDLRATIASAGDLTGANLTDAALGWATLLVPLDGADLSGASAVNASLGSLTGANLAAADLTRARVDVTFFDAQRSETTVLDELRLIFQSEQSLEGYDFGGLNLRGWVFRGTLNSNMRDVDFSQATLDGVLFDRVDLTGAIFGSAPLDVEFSGVTCPDGYPSDESKSGAAVCRLN